jgi:hypothetical protein
MSALGQKQTFFAAKTMSALPLKADIRSAKQMSASLTPEIGHSSAAARQAYPLAREAALD